MTSVAVIAHQMKTLGGGLSELRRALSDRGFGDPIWYEVAKSRKAPAKARKAVDQGDPCLHGQGSLRLQAVSWADLSDSDSRHRGQFCLSPGSERPCGGV